MATTTRVLTAAVSGTVYTTNANGALEAIDTCHSGATAPTNEVANGKLWLDTTTTPGILKIYNNATWEVVLTATGTSQVKLDGIEALADVTDVTNVTAAGALMDSEVTNLTQVKAFDTTDYATAAQGTLAGTALQPTGNGSGLTNLTSANLTGALPAIDGSALTGLVLTKEYVSSQQTISNGLRLTLAHGLGARPKLLTFHLLCVTDDNGFVVGDEIKVEPHSHTSNNNYTFSFWLDDTSNINIEFGTETPIFKVINKAGVRATLTNANWKFVARGWL